MRPASSTPSAGQALGARRQKTDLHVAEPAGRSASPAPSLRSQRAKQYRCWYSLNKLQSIPRSRVVFQFHVTLDTVLLLTLFAVFNKKWPVIRMNCSNSVARVSWYLDIYSAYRFPICLSVLQVFYRTILQKRISVTMMTVQCFLTVDVNVSYFQLNLPYSVIRTQLRFKTCCFELARPALSVWTVSIVPIELLNCYSSRTFLILLAKIK